MDNKRKSLTPAVIILIILFIIAIIISFVYKDKNNHSLVDTSKKYNITEQIMADKFINNK